MSVCIHAISTRSDEKMMTSGHPRSRGLKRPERAAVASSAKTGQPIPGGMQNLADPP